MGLILLTSSYVKYVISSAIESFNLGINSHPRESVIETDFGEDREGEERLHCIVHQGVGFDKIHGYVGQRPRVIDASTWSRLWDLFREHAQPVAVYRFLFLERPLEDVEYTAHREGAHRRATNWVNWRREDPVNQLVVAARVKTRRRVAHRLWKNKIKFFIKTLNGYELALNYEETFIG